MDQTTSRTGHENLDLPELSPHRYHTAHALPIVFLFKTPNSEREAIMKSIVDGSKSALNAHKDRPIGTIPWVRSFAPTNEDIGRMASSLAIFIDENMLKQGLCIACHVLEFSKTQFGRHTYEFASVKLSEAYDLVANIETQKSWFPHVLNEAERLEFPHPVDDQISQKKPEVPEFENEVPVIMVVDTTDAQREQLQEMLNADLATATLIAIPNTSSDLDDIDFLMEYFLEHNWFPGDFALIDAQTISELADLNEKGIAGENNGGAPNYPSFTLVSEMQIRYDASDKQSVGRDEVGYAVWRRIMEDENEFQEWCGCCFRGMGLGSYGGWWDGEGEWDQGERYYWGCWLNEKGRVDGEVRGEAVLKY